MSLATGTFRPRGRKPRIPIFQPWHRLSEGLEFAMLAVEGAGVPRDFAGQFSPTATGGTFWWPGDRGPAYSFQGANGLVVGNQFSPLKELGVSCWFNTDTEHTGTLISKRDQSNFYPFLLRVEPAYGIAAYAWTANEQDPGTPIPPVAVVRQAGVPVFGTGWRHVAVTFGGGVLSMYLDGILIDTGSGGGDVIVQTPAPWRIGFDGVGTGQRLIGLISDACIWSRALSPDEIQELSLGLYEEWTPQIRRPMIVVPQMPSLALIRQANQSIGRGITYG